MVRANSLARANEVTRTASAYRSSNQIKGARPLLIAGMNDVVRELFLPRLGVADDEYEPPANNGC